MEFANKQKIFGVIGILIAAIMWGFDGVFLTPNLYSLPVPLVVLTLHLFPALLLSIIFFKKFKYLAKFTFQDYLFFTLIALSGGSIGTLAIVKALFLVNFSKLSIVILLQKLQPIFAITLSFLILREKINKNFIIWSLIAIIASYFLSFGFNLPLVGNNANTVKAIFYSLLAALSFGSATVFGKKVLEKYDFLTATLYRYVFTSILMIIYLYLIEQSFNFGAITSRQWLFFSIIFVTTGTSAILLYYYALKHVKASIATICELFFPLSAIIFDYYLNNNILSPIQWISAAVLVGAVLKISLDRKI